MSSLPPKDSPALYEPTPDNRAEPVREGPDTGLGAMLFLGAALVYWGLFAWLGCAWDLWIVLPIGGALAVQAIGMAASDSRITYYAAASPGGFVWCLIAVALQWAFDEVWY